MEQSDAATAFATLGHPGRLAVLALLMRFAPRGMRPTEMAATLSLKPNTLSHHLSDLCAARLIRVRRKGRSLFYSVDLDHMQALLGHLALDIGRARPDLLAPIAPSAPLPDRIHHVLFICSGNSARSIMAEALLRDLGQGRFVAHSAGTRPGSRLHPITLSVLDRNGHAIGDLRAKHIAEFQQPHAVAMDFVFTVCDAAASEECPPWSGQPITGHWGLPDPASAQGTDAEKSQVFARIHAALRRRITAFVDLPMASLDRGSLQAAVDRIDAGALDAD